jgi:DNA-binding response OmpR family regulator
MSVPQQVQSESQKQTVLLIDDNGDMLELLRETLNKDYHCLSASRGDSGVEIAVTQLPDIVISDVMMPGISGYEVLQKLKNNDITSHIPVILLTAKGSLQNRLQGWAEKADEYLEKPFSASELLYRMDNLLAIRSLLRQRFQRSFVNPESSKHDETQRLNTIGVVAIQVEPPPLTINTVQQVFLDKLTQVLEAHYADEVFGVELLAKAMNQSRRQLGRKMKAVMDLTPVESIRNYRLKKAAQLLVAGVSPSVVTYQVGFSSLSYFGQCFKAQFDCLPSQYAQLHNQDQASSND